MILKDVIEKTAHNVEKTLDRILPPLSKDTQALDAPLIEGMRYVTLEGGKRIRSFLTTESAALFDVPESQALRVAAAVEMIHSFSLVHDDLPCMDNADLRRGKPSCHMRFGEASAVLIGDGLQALAFETIAHPDTHPLAEIRASLCLELARSLGASGLCAGQMIDIAAENKTLSMNNIILLEHLKTGSLFSFCCKSGAILGRAPEEAFHALNKFAYDFSVVFQITDDLLDLEGKTEEVGKPTGSDALLGKATIVNLLGKKEAFEHASLLIQEAIYHLDYFGEKADPLKDLTRSLLKRRS